MADIRPRVLVLGHSFVRRLFTDVQAGVFPSNFNLSQCDIRGLGIGGGTVQGFYSDRRIVDLFQTFQPHIVILQIGGNDCCDSRLSPSKLASDIYSLSVYLYRTWGSHVWICELFTRPSPRGMASPVYESRRQDVNKALSVLVVGHDHVNLWRHKRIFQSPLRLFLSDGCHLNSAGMTKYFRSIRHVVKQACVRFSAASCLDR